MVILMSRDMTTVNVAVEWVNNIVVVGWVSGMSAGDRRVKEIAISTSGMVITGNGTTE